MLLEDVLEPNLLVVPGSSSSGETAAADLDLLRNLLVNPELVPPYLVDAGASSSVDVLLAAVLVRHGAADVVVSC